MGADRLCDFRESATSSLCVAFVPHEGWSSTALRTMCFVSRVICCVSLSKDHDGMRRKRIHLGNVNHRSSRVLACNLCAKPEASVEFVEH